MAHPYIWRLPTAAKDFKLADSESVFPLMHRPTGIAQTDSILRILLQTYEQRISAGCPSAVQHGNCKVGTACKEGA